MIRKGMSVMYEKWIKRYLDTAIALLALPFVTLIMIPVGIAIKIEDGGDIFYLSKRYGIHMKKFKMIKFRTMKMNAPDIRNQDGSTYNSADDSRLTKVGSFLRKNSIDEIPQLINVLFGDMSLVGPRPSPMGNETTYTDFVKQKFDVRPGITGYNQALLRNSATLEERYKNDVFYAQNISFMFDVKILCMTVKAVIKHSNIYH